MRQMQRVLWTKGVLLDPQHLQAQDRYLEDKLGFHLSALAPASWGLLDLEMDPDALAGGEVRMTRAAGLFPDGLPFHVPVSDRAPAPRSLEGHWKPDQESLTVYLAIPEYREGGRNVSPAGEDAGTRYSPEVLSLRDEHTGLAEKEILVARKNFRLLLEGEASEGASAIPVARLVRSDAGEVRYDPDFVPPVLDVSASDRLLSILRKLVEVLAARSAELGGARRQQNRSLADFGRSDIAHFWLLYTVNSHLPVVRHLYEPARPEERDGDVPRVRRAHPLRLYRAMVELAATLMTFEPSRHPRDLPSYDHARLGPCFAQLERILLDLLETAVPSNCDTLLLEPVGNSIYATRMTEDRHASAIQAYLAVTSEMEQSRLIEKAPGWIKIGSRDAIQHLLGQALPGVSFRHVATPPSAVPVKMGCQYFRLEMSGRRWSEILESRTVAAWVASEIEEPTLELVLLLPDGT